MTTNEIKANIIVRKTTIQDINEAIIVLQKNNCRQTFSPMSAIQILEEKRFKICQEITKLDEHLKTQYQEKVPK